jgi:ferrous iron transport protein A
MSLYKIKKATNCIIESVPAQKILESLGIRKGVNIRVLVRQPFGGPVVVRVGQRDIAISHEYAKQITVKEVV